MKRWKVFGTFAQLTLGPWQGDFKLYRFKSTWFCKVFLGKGKSLTLARSTHSKLWKVASPITKSWWILFRIRQSESIEKMEKSMEKSQASNPHDSHGALPRMLLGLDLSTALKLQGSTGAAKEMLAVTTCSIACRDHGCTNSDASQSSHEIPEIFHWRFWEDLSQMGFSHETWGLNWLNRHEWDPRWFQGFNPWTPVSMVGISWYMNPRP